MDQAVGKIKRSVGEAVGSENLANQGVVRQAKGAVEETWGDAKDAARHVQESRSQAAADKADQNRNQLSQSIENSKNKIKDKIEEIKVRHSS
jgi:uncharacterized protein YjbJ (UPF0337 family)